MTDQHRRAAEQAYAAAAAAERRRDPAMADLNIPDAAERAFLTGQSDAYGDRHTGVAYREGLAAAARLIVAAELRRLAEQLISEENAHAMWRAIGRRADELDSGGQS